MTNLSVNINKIATLRNARGGNMPDLLKAAVDIQHYGAEGITVHPRPDERHVRYRDVYDLKPLVFTELNVEGYPSKDFLKLVLEVKPDQVTLVPDPPGVLTSNAGWDTITNQEFLKDVVALLKESGMRVSLFIDPEEVMVEKAKETGSDRIEFYTESYAKGYETNPESSIKSFIAAALVAEKVGLGINAGHDLNLKNLGYFKRMIPGLLEVSIGHALISDALYLGLEKTIHSYLQKLK